MRPALALTTLLALACTADDRRRSRAGGPGAARSGRIVAHGATCRKLAPMLRPWSIVVSLAALVGALCAVVSSSSDALADSKVLARGRVETPEYTVVRQGAGFELRSYEQRLVAEVEVTGDPRQATNAGFRLLAGFIFGNNMRAEEVAMTAPVDRRAASAEKIAMTAPVDRQRRGDRWIITFTMPSKYTLATLPRPKDARVQIRELPAVTFAVRQFSGSPDEDGVQKEIAALRQAVLAAGLKVVDAPPVFSRYDPPWTPGFMRRNEVMLEIAAEPVPAPAK